MGPFFFFITLHAFGHGRRLKRRLDGGLARVLSDDYVWISAHGSCGVWICSRLGVALRIWSIDDDLIKTSRFRRV